MEEKNTEIKFDAEWFKDSRDFSVYEDEIIKESMKYVANLNITKAKSKMLQIIDFNIPKKLKLCTDEDGNAKAVKVNKYNITDNKYAKFFEKFKTEHNREHFYYRAKQHFAQFDYADEEKFDKLNYYLWTNIFLTADTQSAIREFKHWLINTKKAISLDTNNTTKYETIFGLWEPNGKTGKSYLLEAICKAITIDEKLITTNSNIFKFNSYLLEDAIGVIYKDEIGDFVNHKDKLKELITSKTVTLEGKGKDPYFIQKTFSLLVSGNKPLGPYLFDDEGDGQRRNATIKARGRIISCKQRDLIEYFKLMLKYCPLDEDTNEYVKNTSTTNEHDIYYWEMVKAIQDIEIQDYKNGKPRHEISKIINANIDIRNYHLPKHNGEFDQILDKILETPGFFKVLFRKGCRSKHYKPTAEFIKLKLNDEFIQLEDNEYLLNNNNKPAKTFEQMRDEALGNNPSGPNPGKTSAKDESHKITLSFAVERGTNSTQLEKADFTTKQLADYLISEAPKTEEKTDAYLISNGYSNEDTCGRKEENFTEINSILLDCDNEQADKDLLKKFDCEYFQLEKVVYQTASSTSEKPKFRVIIPLDEPISLTGNIKMRHIKKAVAKIFEKYTDPKASWFFTPTKDKIETIKYYSGQAFKSWDLIQKANEFTAVEALDNACFEEKAKLYNGDNPEGWRNFQAVKDCFTDLREGNRDDLINAACYAMQKNNFTKADIREFLSEIPPVGKDFKDIIVKFTNKYCR